MRRSFSIKHLFIPLALAVFSTAAITVSLIAGASAQRALSADVQAECYDRTVIIDAGHGGPDGGAVGFDGTVEKGINLDISLKLKSFFVLAGYKVIMVREDDRSVCDADCRTIRDIKSSDLHNRLKLSQANPKALYISIHQNKYSEQQYSGTQVFYSKGNADSKELAQDIQSAAKSLLQPDNARVIKPAEKNLYVLYYNKAPAVMVECGFLSNPNECRKLCDSSYQNDIAFAVFCGAMQFYSQH